jgi:hypothetical protein
VTLGTIGMVGLIAGETISAGIHQDAFTPDAVARGPSPCSPTAIAAHELRISRACARLGGQGRAGALPPRFFASRRSCPVREIKHSKYKQRDRG